MSGDVLEWLKILVTIGASLGGAAMIAHGFASKVKVDLALLNAAVARLEAAIKEAGLADTKATIRQLQEDVKKASASARQARRRVHWLANVFTGFSSKVGEILDRKDLVKLPPELMSEEDDEE